jgi:hypothetical protein
VLVLNIEYEEHAFIRLTNRSCQFGLDLYETLERIEETIAEGRLSRSKRSKKNVVYYKYFHDNLSFFVFCRKCFGGFVIKTIIISEGRE